MNLDDAQKSQVRSWIQAGLKLSDIQKKLQAEFDLRLTYMELRFLLDDLSLAPKDAEPPKDLPAPAAPGPKQAAGSAKAVPPEQAWPQDDDSTSTPGDVSVSVDQVTRPGAIVSGKVTFSDGKNADWYLDQTGRLGIAPAEQGYKPSQADLMIFQGELQSELAKLGF